MRAKESYERRCARVPENPRFRNFVENLPAEYRTVVVLSELNEVS